MYFATYHNTKVLAGHHIQNIEEIQKLLVPHLFIPIIYYICSSISRWVEDQKMSTNIYRRKCATGKESKNARNPTVRRCLCEISRTLPLEEMIYTININMISTRSEIPSFAMYWGQICHVMEGPGDMSTVVFCSTWYCRRHNKLINLISLSSSLYWCLCLFIFFFYCTGFFFIVLYVDAFICIHH